MSTSVVGKVYDYAVVGGGIVGLATARELLQRYPERSVVVLEKEREVAQHQSSHNSGVIHAGMYYAPGSLKARLCVEGAAEMYAYAERNRVPHRRVGKLIVAADGSEMEALERIFKRGIANGVKGLSMLSAREVTEREPLVKGAAGIWSPDTGIIDYGAVARSMAREISAAADRRGDVVTGFPVAGFERHEGLLSRVDVHSTDHQCVSARLVVTAAGLQADRVAALAGASAYPRVVPFRGSFLKMRASHRQAIKHLVYPVPHPSFPFLGVHVTPTTGGELLLGPNAVLAFAREGYDYRTVRIGDLTDMASNGGLLRLAARHWAHGLRELYRDVVPAAFVTAVQRYMPSLRVEQTERGPAGVRAIALAADGSIIDDFVFQRSPGFLHVRNAPSPAATSSLAIARVIVDALGEQ
ncbi:MAG: L-2-hydroxyglutarate oxidase [archaeon]|nr:L-2-hydroxyglutarate oxidase [archaeon]